MTRDPFQVLGVSPDADEKTIKTAYKKLAMKHHPDRKGGSEAKMKEISEAYNRITNGDTGQNPFGDNFGWSTSSNMSQDDLHDILSGFGDFFTRGFGGFGGPHPDVKYRASQRKGRDVAMDLPISFHQMWFGYEHLLQINGKTLSVKTPPGVRHGTRIRYTGHGLPPNQLGTPGDLIITVLVQQDDKYSIEGNTVIANQHISVWDAIIGGDVEYKHVDDRVLKISINPGTQHGQLFRIPGYGINNGDLIVRAVIEVPSSKSLTKEQKEVIMKWKNKK
jgi:curved DNA-binding protein